jgi:hypothetical protein
MFLGSFRGKTISIAAVPASIKECFTRGGLPGVQTGSDWWMKMCAVIDAVPARLRSKQI